MSAWWHWINSQFSTTASVELLPFENTTAGPPSPVEHALTAEDVNALKALVRRIPVSREVVQYAVCLSSATRPTGIGGKLDWIQRWIRWGAGPRASQYLILAGKARAALRGDLHVSYDDVRASAFAVLRHRIITNFHAESEGIKSDQIIERLIKEIDPHKLPI